MTVTLPFDPAAVPAGVTPALFKTTRRTNGKSQRDLRREQRQRAGHELLNGQAVTESPDAAEYRLGVGVPGFGRRSAGRLWTLPGADGSGSQSSTEGVLDRGSGITSVPLYFDRPVQTEPRCIIGGAVQPRRPAGIRAGAGNPRTASRSGCSLKRPTKNPTNGQAAPGSATRLVAESRASRRREAGQRVSDVHGSLRSELETTDLQQHRRQHCRPA